eukprot:c20698_g3_i5.p1 GENE.c20698_g3_i5~~c20698_g3_i5.p1  ORF type:complete len:153 (-),score=26.40 c20698_g3_i5:39-497(-)
MRNGESGPGSGVGRSELLQEKYPGPTLNKKCLTTPGPLMVFDRRNSSEGKVVTAQDKQRNTFDKAELEKLNLLSLGYVFCVSDCSGFVLMLLCQRLLHRPSAQSGLCTSNIESDCTHPNSSFTTQNQSCLWGFLCFSALFCFVLTLLLLCFF